MSSESQVARTLVLVIVLARAAYRRVERLSRAWRGSAEIAASITVTVLPPRLSSSNLASSESGVLVPPTNQYLTACLRRTHPYYYYDDDHYSYHYYYHSPGELGGAIGHMRGAAAMGPLGEGVDDVA